MSVEKALELLEKTSENLTALACDMEAGELRTRLVAIAEDLDDYLYHEAEEEAEVDEYEDDDEDEDYDDRYELDLDDEDDEEAA